MFRWAYGVTTCPERRSDLLPRTLESLRLAGFDQPRLFVDASNVDLYHEYKGQYPKLEITHREPRIRPFANWVLALLELYFRDPDAQRYAIFQDDIVTYRNLRQYLDRRECPRKGYWNLHTKPSNEGLAPTKDYKGFYLSDQWGKGALALVFNKETLFDLMSVKFMYERAQDKQFGWRKIDGTVVDSMKFLGYQEFVHYPTLTQHTGEVSSISNHAHILCESFRGEDFDAMDLLK